MSFHRIKKYSRQIVSQDCVLSCQSNNIGEIPFFKNAQVNSVSLQNQKTRSGGERSIWLERDLDLSGMLMCWHLLNSRSVPLSAQKKKAENQRRTAADKREKVCQSSLTLRGHSLYMAIEKYLLFLMPREIRKKRIIHSLHNLSLRRDRVCLSTFYVNTALGLCQYKMKKTSLQTILWHEKKGDLQPKSLTLSPERMFFPCFAHTYTQAGVARTCTQLTQKYMQVQSVQTQNSTSLQDGRSRGFSERGLSLHCPSVLFSPDIQDIAQSGMTLEGSLTLEFF